MSEQLPDEHDEYTARYSEVPLIEGVCLFGELVYLAVVGAATRALDAYEELRGPVEEQHERVD